MSGSTAAVTYVSASNTFVFTTAPATASSVAVGDVLIYDTVGGTNPITLRNPGGIASPYTLTFPAAVPVASGSMIVDPSGRVTFSNILSASNVSLTGTTAVNVKTPNFNVDGNYTGTGSFSLENSVAIDGNRISTPATMIFSASTSGSSYIFSGSSLGVVYTEGKKTYTANKRIMNRVSPISMVYSTGSYGATNVLQRTLNYVIAPTGSLVYAPLLLPNTGTIVSFIAVLQVSGTVAANPRISLQSTNWDEGGFIDSPIEFPVYTTSGSRLPFTGTLNVGINPNKKYAIVFTAGAQGQVSTAMTVVGLTYFVDTPISYDEGFNT